MSQRTSGYTRKARDSYQTPAWVTHAVGRQLPGRIKTIWEPAAGDGRMVHALLSLDYKVFWSDIERGKDFLRDPPAAPFDAIVTNPPFSQSRQFIERALELTWGNGGTVAMLLRCDFDHGKTRAHLFGDCPAFARKLVLTRRIVWFEKPGAAPSENHAWFIWDWRHKGPPTIAYDNKAQACTGQSEAAE